MTKQDWIAMSSSSTKQPSFFRRQWNRLFPPPPPPKDDEVEFEKGLTPIADYLFEKRVIVRTPKWNYVTIYAELVKSWVYRQIQRAITQEVMNTPVELEPNFAMKCDACLAEYDTEVEECKVCEGKSFTTPDLEQRKAAQELMDNPNSEYSFDDLMRSALGWHIMLDDVYLSIAYKDIPRLHTEVDEETGEEKALLKEVTQAAEVFVEDSRYMFPVADEWGKLGNEEYFCPKHYDYKLDNYVVPNEDGSIPPCPECGGECLETAYVMMTGKQIRQRLSEKEIAMDNTDAMKPELQGNPKAIAVWKLFKTINNIDDLNEETYREGSVGGIITFPGMKQADLTRQKQKMETEILKANSRDATTGQRTKSKKVHVIFLAVKEGTEPEFIPALPDSKEMEQLETYKLYRDSICAVYGVTPVFVSIIESGKSGNNPRMQIDVQKGTTQEHQAFLENLWNEKVLPLFGVTDWGIKFGAIEAVDDLREAQVWEHRANAAQTLTGLGFPVTFDEHGNLEVGLEPEEEPAPEETPEQFEPEQEEAPMSDEVSPESGDWPVPPKRDNKFPDETAEALRVELEEKFLRIIDDVKSVGDAKKSYAAAKEVMDEMFPRILESARVALAKTLESELPSIDDIPADVMKKLRAQKNERMRDMRKLIRLELKRKDEPTS
jgi:hypothetical protein